MSKKKQHVQITKEDIFNRTDIAWSKTLTSDDIDMALDSLKGVTALLQALELSSDAGKHKHDKYAYLALGLVCNSVIDEIEDMKPNIDYMQEKIREV